MWVCVVMCACVCVCAVVCMCVCTYLSDIIFSISKYVLHLSFVLWQPFKLGENYPSILEMRKMKTSQVH